MRAPLASRLQIDLVGRIPESTSRAAEVAREMKMDNQAAGRGLAKMARSIPARPIMRSWFIGDAINEAVDIYYHIDPEDVRKEYMNHIPQLGV